MRKVIVLISAVISFGTQLQSQVQVDKFTGDVSYGLPLITVPNFRGPSVSTSLSYRSDIKVDQPASEVGLGWNINAGGSVERIVNGVPDDWKDVFVPDMQAASFQKHLGALYFDEATAFSTVLDFDYTRYKMDTLNDTLKHYYPNYDTYFVTGAGMAGKIIPENYDYPTVEVDTTEVSRWFYREYYHSTYGWLKDSVSIGIKEIETYTLDMDGFIYDYKTHFSYEHNMYDEVDSKAFPWAESPIDSSTIIHIPEDSTYNAYPTYNGTGYNDEDYSISANRNRTRTSNYIEYFTNSEIDAGVTGFMEYDTTFTRDAEADFPQDGIGAYRITDPNGYTYHYSLPVYAHYNTSGSTILDQEFNKMVLDGDNVEITDSTDGYIVENEYTHEILELKQIKKYAVRWLLTAITGPDFEDSNSNGVVDDEDKGYWVKYNYGLWTESFSQRYPYYGASYNYSASVEESPVASFLAETDEGKMTGNMLAYSETANQVYYLNEIQTPSHTGIFCRDLRYDEQSMVDNFDYYEYTSTENLKNVTEDIVYYNGSGRFSFGSELTSPEQTFSITIDPEGVDSILLYIDELFVGGYNDTIRDTLRVYDGEDNTGTVLFEKYHGTETFSVPGSVTSSGPITIEYIWTTDHSDLGFYEIRWESKWANAMAGWPAGRPASTPQLKLSKLFLFDNEDYDNLPAITSVDTIASDDLWNYNNVNNSNFYNSNWYEANQTSIDTLALQSVDLDQDYSLAKGYHNNRFVFIDTQSKTVNQLEVEANKYIATNSADSSGKLTLNKVIYYGLNRTQTQPSHLFNYNASDSTDNPYYDATKQDYWGNYKNDVDSNLLRGYVTDTSSNQTDAWSLRTVTTPLGGTTEIVYESDEYEQVLTEDNDGEIRGPIKTYALNNLHVVADGSGNYGADWLFGIENQESEFWKVYDSLPVGTDTLIVIPSVWVQPQDTGYNYSINYQEANGNYSGALCYGLNSGIITNAPNKITSLPRFYDVNIQDGTPIQSSFILDSNFDSLTYSGGGYIEFQYPVGQKVKGGGTRVKELKVSNGNDIYTVSYNYEQGTATSEAGDFSKHKIKTGALGNDYYSPLTSYDYNPFGMSPQIGYGKVSIENKGQINSGQGKSIFLFNVSDEDYDYFEPYYMVMDTSFEDTNEPCSFGYRNYDDKRYAVEIVDNFTSVWGKIKEQRLLDVNDNMVSKKVYEYEVSTKGANVEVVNYELKKEFDNCIVNREYITIIKRSYPNYLTKVTTYSNGRVSTSEIVERDPFTGDPIETKNTSVNNTETREEIILAYTQTTPDYSEMGAKSVDPSYNNFLNASYSSKSYKEAEGVTTSDFSSWGKSFWKDSVTTRYYDETNNEYQFETQQVNWYDYTKYAWTGALGDYGLFDTTSVPDITEPPVSASDWRLLSQITLMDEEQNVLEQKGYNDRFSASKLGYDNRFTYTSASNSNYVSFTATGFETETEVESGVVYYEGEVKAQSGNTRLLVDGSVYPHTGNYMVGIPAIDNSGPIYKVNYSATEDLQSLQRGRTYTASVWVHKDSPSDTKLNITIEGDVGAGSHSDLDTMSIANSKAIQIGDWIQLTVNLEVPSDFTGTAPGDGLEVYVDKTTTSPAWIDDMLFHSRVSGSGMNVYDQRTGRVMATLSDNNFATKYIYNDAGQVVEVWKEVLDEGWVKVESRDFNFKRDME